MNQVPVWLLFISIFLILHTPNALELDVRSSFISFLEKLSNRNGQLDPRFGGNSTSDPCIDQWNGVTCDNSNTSVRKLLFDGFNLSGVFDASSLCNVQSLAASLSVISLNDNNISGDISFDIAECKQLTHFHVSGNKFFGNLPDSLSMLKNLKQLEISNNSFSGNLPDLSRISGLNIFIAQYNQLTGEIPPFDFSNLRRFNVSYNNFSGQIPDVNGQFPESSFLGNPQLCGDPLPIKCPSSQKIAAKSGVSKDQVLMYSGYAILGLSFITLIFCRLFRRKKKEEKKVDSENKVAAVDDSSSKPSAATESVEYKTDVSRSEFSVTSANSGVLSSSLVVLTSPVVNGLKFEDLLQAPAELLGRGKHGSLYKVIFENGMILAVKRIKDWGITSDEFKQRMQRIDQAKHPNVLPALAFYCSKQEKLLVYEYQQNGSLFRLLHGTQMGQAITWAGRLGIAASIAEVLAFMHQELRDDGIGHGNLKSSNIMLNKNMEPCLSEYGLMVEDDQDSSTLVNVKQIKTGASSTFQLDIYGFGVILLELLTGKLVQNNGVDLTTWVHSVVREEWTVEVFDKSLFSEGASEERMVNLLQVAIKCVNCTPEARPSINQVAAMIHSIKEEEERSFASLVFEP